MSERLGNTIQLSFCDIDHNRFDLNTDKLTKSEDRVIFKRGKREAILRLSFRLE